MSFRTVTIKTRAKLELKLGYIIIRGEDEKRIHLSEIATLIIESTGVACTSALLCELIKRNISVIFCDEKHMPHFYLTPFANNYASSKNIKQQSLWDDDRKKVIWTFIIKNKIKMQSKLLEKFGKQKEAEMLNNYTNELKLGDSTNREGHAAKVYFNALFGQEFSRRNDDFDVNAKLNYGYAILLSAISREISAYGYITQLGIWHKGDQNNYNLASDLIEPFRTIVDDFVLTNSSDGALSKSMPNVMLAKVMIFNKEQYLESALNQYVRSAINFMEFKCEELPIIDEYFFTDK